MDFLRVSSSLALGTGKLKNLRLYGLYRAKEMITKSS